MSADAVEGEIVVKGRPTKFDETIVGKLEAAFQNGFNITEACQYAEIDRTTYYDWLAQDDIFSYRMSVAQSAPTRAAKALVISAIQKGDANLAFRWLERRDPDFKPKTTLEPPEGQVQTEQKLKEFMDDTNDGAYADTAAADAGSSQSTAATEPAGGNEMAPSPTDIS